MVILRPRSLPGAIVKIRSETGSAFMNANGAAKSRCNCGRRAAMFGLMRYRRKMAPQWSAEFDCDAPEVSIGEVKLSIIFRFCGVEQP